MTYLFQSSACLIVLYLFYYLLLRGDKSFNLHRAYLMTALLVSAVIPVLGIFWTVPEPLIEIPLFIGDLPAINEEGVAAASQTTNWTIGWKEILWTLYGLGTLYFLVRFFYRLMMIATIIKAGQQQKENGYTLVITEQEVPLSSFYRFIFIKPEYLQNNDWKYILLHERKHLQDLHTIDRLLLEVFKIFFWFNPIIYLYSQSLKTIHEFICDEAVVSNTSLSHYERVLIESLFKKMNLSLLSQFNEISIKNRITMMNKTEKKGFYSWVKLSKTLLIIPVLVLLIWTCNQENLPTVSERVVAGTITSASGKPLPGVNIVATGAQIGSVSNLEGKYKLTIPGDIESLTFSFIGFKTQEIEVGERSIINVEFEEDPNAAPIGKLEPKFQVTKAISEEGEDKLISGEVKDNNGKPLSGVKVIIYTKETKEKIETITSEQGEYSMKMPADAYIIIFQKGPKELVVQPLTTD